VKYVLERCLFCGDMQGWYAHALEISRSSWMQVRLMQWRCEWRSRPLSRCLRSPLCRRYKSDLLRACTIFRRCRNLESEGKCSELCSLAMDWLDTRPRSIFKPDLNANPTKCLLLLLRPPTNWHLRLGDFGLTWTFLVQMLIWRERLHQTIYIRRR